MTTGGEDRTSEFRLTAEDMEGDLDMTVREDELDEKGRPLIDWVKPVEWLLPNAEVYEEWEEDEEDQDVDFIDLYESDEEDGNSSEDSDEIYGEEKIYEEEDNDKEEDNDDDDDYDNDQYLKDVGEAQDQSSHSLSLSEDGDLDMIGAGETSGSGLGRANRDFNRPQSASATRGLYSDAAENRFRASTQEIGERLLGRAMTPKDFFTSPEDQQDSIEHIITKRKRLFAGNARLIIDLEAAAREDAEEQGIDLEEMDRIDREMDRLALLNMSRQQFPRRVKKEPEN